MGRIELLEQALRLDARDRAGIAARLLESLEDLTPAELDKLWADEAENRDRAVDRGELDSKPAEQVIAEIKVEFK